MIIDVHAHIGIVPGGFYMPLENQLAGMKKYKIDYALISDITCGESQTKPKEDIPYQTLLNEQAAQTVRSYSDKLGLMLWCRPNAEQGFTTDFEHVFLQNRDVVKGIKIHPDISGLPFNDPKIYPYLEMAQEYSLPVLIHTKETYYSKVCFVCEMARRFPAVDFILGHMSLSDDKTESFRALQEYPNIYGDTAWVNYADVVRACAQGLEDKILFGTDSPIAGADTYGDKAFYPEYYTNPDLSAQTMQKIMCTNAQQLFHLTPDTQIKL